MWLETVPNRNSPPAILLREGWREGSTVRKRTVANLSSWSPAKIEALRLLLHNQPLVSPDQLFTIARSLPHGHVELVLGSAAGAISDPQPDARGGPAGGQGSGRSLVPARRAGGPPQATLPRRHFPLGAQRDSARRR